MSAAVSTVPAPAVVYVVTVHGVLMHWTETFTDREKAIVYAARMMLAGFAATLTEERS